MRALREVVWSLVGVSAVGLAICACGASDTGTQEPSSEPTGSGEAHPDLKGGGEVHPDMTNVGCTGAAGCACSPTAPCTQPDTFCAHPANICALTTPCGNCGHVTGGGPPGGSQI